MHLWADAALSSIAVDPFAVARQCHLHGIDVAGHAADTLMDRIEFCIDRAAPRPLPD